MFTGRSLPSVLLTAPQAFTARGETVSHAALCFIKLYERDQTVRCCRFRCPATPGWRRCCATTGIYSANIKARSSAVFFRRHMLMHLLRLSGNRMALASAINNRYTGAMRSIAKRFLLLFLVLWLPTQSYAATAMPGCTGGGHATTATQTCEHIGTDHQTAASAGVVCDDCAVCHTSGVFFAAVITPPSYFNVVRDSRLASRFFSIVLERFQRPPLAS